MRRAGEIVFLSAQRRTQRQTMIDKDGNATRLTFPELENALIGGLVIAAVWIFSQPAGHRLVETRLREPRR